MDYMDIDEIEEVPDTPEQYITTHNNHNNSTGKQSDGSSSCCVIDKDRFNENLRNEPREKGKSVTINGSRRLFDVGNMSSNMVDIKDLITETKDSHRFKGKGVYPSFREDPNARNRHLSQRSSDIFKESTNSNKESEGWITIHNDQHISRGKSASSNNIYNDFEDFQRESGPPDTMYLRAHDLGQFQERAQLTKRQRDNVVLNYNNREFDVPNLNDSDIASSSVCIETSSSRLTRVKNHRGPVISVDELSNEDVNHGLSTNHCSYEDSGVRALQLEADEMLAKELQEQLYNEELGSAFGINQMDSHAIYAGGRSASRPASRVSSSNLYQQSGSNASRNHSANRGPQAQTATSSRLTRFRGHFPGNPRSLSSRNSIFPPNMNVDMRMEILEALEAFNDMELPFNDMELPNDLLAFNDMEFPNELLQVGREFNENDYEMLLALDENNDRHEGATRAQINNLPESKVQAENHQECAICLETPTIGETIRHLPCLHKFHKDCIDEWLKRKTSCPVCKSSVT